MVLRIKSCFKDVMEFGQYQEIYAFCQAVLLGNHFDAYYRNH